MVCVFQNYGKSKESMRHFFKCAFVPSPANCDCPANLPMELLQTQELILQKYCIENDFDCTGGLKQNTDMYNLFKTLQKIVT